MTILKQYGAVRKPDVGFVSDCVPCSANGTCILPPVDHPVYGDKGLFFLDLIPFVSNCISSALYEQGP